LFSNVLVCKSGSLKKRKMKGNGVGRNASPLNALEVAQLKGKGLARK
jgi:hypothetical protein